MKITCPHKKVIEVVVLGDVTCYRHEDENEYCVLMNDFATRASDVSATYVQNLVYNHEVTSLMRVVLLSSYEARNHWYMMLSQANGDMLRSMLRGTSQIMSALPQMKDTIVDELYQTFGQVVLTNLYEACKHRIVVPSRNNAGTKPVPLLPMESLIQSNVIATSLEIESRAKARADRTRDTMAALYKRK